jgi:SAM-dependent methyltransferase
MLPAEPVPDVYAHIAEADAATAAQVAGAMELRATDPLQQAMLDGYLDDLTLGAGSRVLEIGCGTGAISRAMARREEIAEVAGVDPSPHLIARAREIAGDAPGLSFAEGDGRELSLGDGEFDAVVLHTVLSHVPGPERVLAEARRVVRPGGRLAVFDGDYATITLATGEHDPLQACADAFAPAFIHDPWLVRRLPALVRGAGFEDPALRSHGYVQVDEPAYLLSIADRGADALVAGGRIGPALAEALKAEARRRVEAGTFFGHIAYASLLARAPG